MDPWSTNAWSTDENEEIPNRHQLAPKWEVPSEDNNESTTAPIVDLPPWSVASDSVWGTGNDVWTSVDDNASGEPSWNQNWKAETISLPSQLVEPNAKSPEVEAAVRPALPTPPSSPPTTSVSLPLKDWKVVEEDSVLEVSEPLEAVETPDPFGSFESAQETPVIISTSNDLSWPTDLTFGTGHSLDEPWKSSWESPVNDPSPTTLGPKDDWEAAQEAQRRFNDKIPQERLQSIISQWETIAQQHYSNYKMPEGQDYSWRKGLDNVVGLSERVDNLIPSTYFTLPTPFPQSEIAKAVKNALRLTRSCPLSQLSPMGHFYALKGSSEWEDLVKMQGSAAKDEWGWDLKQGKEEFSDPQEPVKGPERKSGFLSFWKRRTPSESTTAAAPTPGGAAASNVQHESSRTEKKEKEQPQSQPQTQPSTPTLSLRSSFENPPNPPLTFLPSTVALDSDTVVPSTESRISDAESQQVQPSVVSRFLNRLSRRPSSIIVEVAEQPSPSQVALSADDLAFLSDMETKPTVTSDLIHNSLTTSNSFSNSFNERASSNSSNSFNGERLRSSLPPPPPSSSRTTSANKRSDVVDLLGNDTVGSFSVDQRLYPEQANSFKDKPSTLIRQQPPTSLDLFSASFSRSNSSLSPETQPRVLQSTISTILSPPPTSRFGLSPPSSSGSKLDSSSDFNDFDDFVSSGPSLPIKNHSNDNDSYTTGDFGDFVSTSQFSHHRLSERAFSPQPKSYVKNEDQRSSSSVNIPILQPPPKFTASRLELALGTENSPHMGNSRSLTPLSQQTSKPLPRSPPVQPLQAFNVFSTPKAPPSRGSTPRPESTSTIKKSGLSAQDLSFFEGL